LAGGKNIKFPQFDLANEVLLNAGRAVLSAAICKKRKNSIFFGGGFGG